MNLLISHHRARFVAAFFVSGVLLLSAQVASAQDFRSPEVRIFEMTQSGTAESQQHAFTSGDAANENGATVALGDVNGDGSHEVITAAGPGSAPVVRVFNEVGTELASFSAFPDHINIGLNVASGDLDNDGTDEIVIGTMRGGGPYVRVFDMNGTPQFTPGFFAYDEGFRGGVNVAVGNVNGKGGDEIITGAGSGGGPHVRVFNRFGEYTGTDFFPFGSEDKGGVSVGVANVDGGAEEEIVTAVHSFGEPWVKVYKADANKTIVGEFTAYDKSYMGGVNVAGADIDKDGVQEIVTVTRQAGGPHVRVFEGHGAVVDDGYMAYEEQFRGGVSIAAGNVDGDSKAEIVTVPQKKIVEGRLDVFKYIEVDIDAQRVRAYRNGVLEKEVLTSTGLDKFPTPEGEFEVLSKIPVKDYEWSYGTDHPDNYDLENVHNNLRFLPHYYLHEAYWHNNFGNKMSHGCVNLSGEDSEWFYHWADVGDKVFID